MRQIRAYMRRWAFDGVDVMAMPKGSRPKGWELLDVTPRPLLSSDVPLYADIPDDVATSVLAALKSARDELYHMAHSGCDPDDPEAMDSIATAYRECRDAILKMEGNTP